MIRRAYNWIKQKLIRFWKFILIVVFGLSLAFAAPLDFDSKSLETNIISLIKNSQKQYFRKNGIYWQGLKTHLSVPVSSGASLNNISMKPHYQMEGWNDLVVLPDLLPFSMIVNQYEAPNEEFGYQIIIQKRINEIIYEKSIGYGVQSNDRSYDWKILYEQPALSTH